MLNIVEEFLLLELDLEVSFCLSSFYKDLERGFFPKNLRLTKEQENLLNVASTKEGVLHTNSSCTSLKAFLKM